MRPIRSADFGTGTGTPKMAVAWLQPMLRIREVPGTNPSPETGYRDRDLGGFPQSLQKNAGKGPEIKSRPLPSIIISDSLISLSYNAAVSCLRY